MANLFQMVKRMGPLPSALNTLFKLIPELCNHGLYGHRKGIARGTEGQALDCGAYIENKVDITGSSPALHKFAE